MLSDSYVGLHKMFPKIYGNSDTGFDFNPLQNIHNFKWHASLVRYLPGTSLAMSFCMLLKANIRPLVLNITVVSEPHVGSLGGHA